MADTRWWMVLDPYLLTIDVIMTSLLFLTIIYLLANFLILSDALLMSHIIYFHSHHTTPHHTNFNYKIEEFNCKIQIQEFDVIITSEYVIVSRKLC